MGRLIPAGTGLHRYRGLTIGTQMPTEEEVAAALTEEEARALEFLRGGAAETEEEEAPEAAE